MKGFLGHSSRQTGKGVQTKCAIPQDGSYSSSQAAGEGKQPPDAGGYVLVAVVSFAAAAITALCFRLRNRENQKKDGADKPNRHEQEEKSQ